MQKIPIGIAQVDDEAVEARIAQTEAEFFWSRFFDTHIQPHPIAIDGLRGDSQIPKEAGFNQFSKSLIDRVGIDRAVAKPGVMLRKRGTPVGDEPVGTHG